MYFYRYLQRTQNKDDRRSEKGVSANMFKSDYIWDFKENPKFWKAKISAHSAVRHNENRSKNNPVS